jgi:hypothetical protein
LNREGAKDAKGALRVNIFITGYPGDEQISPSCLGASYLGELGVLSVAGGWGEILWGFTDVVFEWKSVRIFWHG